MTPLEKFRKSIPAGGQKMSHADRDQFIRDMPAHLLSPTDKLVLYTLNARTDRSGFCWPSIKTLAQDTGLKHAAISASLTKMREMDLFRRRRRYRGSNIYCLMFELYAERAVDLVEDHMRKFPHEWEHIN